MATRAILADLAEEYRQRTGRSVAIRWMGGVEAARLVRAGEPADIIVLASAVMEKLESERHIVSGSRIGVARSGIAMAVPTGALHPDVSDEQAVKRATLQAGRICFSTGPSGDHLKALWERWGISEAMSQTAIQVPPGIPVGNIVAQGEADLGFQQLSELLHVPGIEIIGPLPPEIQQITVFAAGVSSASSHGENARDFIAFLGSAEAHGAIQRHGMEPAED